MIGAAVGFLLETWTWLTTSRPVEMCPGVMLALIGYVGYLARKALLIAADDLGKLHARISKIERGGRDSWPD